MKTRFIRFASFCFVFYLVISTPASAFSRYALLVGVTDYPSLPDEEQLFGPGNDVVLLERLLGERGFEHKNIKGPGEQQGC